MLRLKITKPNKRPIKIQKNMDINNPIFCESRDKGNK